MTVARNIMMSKNGCGPGTYAAYVRETDSNQTKPVTNATKEGGTHHTAS